MVAGGLDADHHELGAELGLGSGDQSLQLGQPGPVGDQPDAVDHHLPQQTAGNHKPGRLGNVDPTSKTRWGSTPPTSSQNAPARWPPRWAPCIIDPPHSAGCSVTKAAWQEGVHPRTRAYQPSEGPSAPLLSRGFVLVVGTAGFEPATPCLQSQIGQDCHLRR
jgi:hypothetical protein